ncbi:peptidoglycan-binding domain-containing protein [Streptomyces camelliae]|uniref:Peptidoglycan-binding domain-containing protein n=1 Tax=Streptomyces camelliae TaxID=3004093 RepID=A0ABY7PE87_9ACTN|nr:peptidoglycan-binding domain-containing protein [Streptomyces sp. HUAS 2-6]WBO66603.1 peptidoglycan-binding domain-containing protein [Streptomyces sp. HUAS 2-6]
MTDSKGPRDPEGHTCPECGAPRGPDLSPSCDCTQRAAEALRETRTAEAAAAEDFDPLRIRPYVKAEAVETTLPLRPLPGASTADLRTFEANAGEGAKPDFPSEQPPEGPRRRSRRTAALLSVAGAGVAVVAAAGFASGLFSYDTPSSRDRAAQEVRESVPEVTPSSASPSPTPPDSPAASRSRVRPPTSAPPPPSASPTPSPSPTTRPPSPPSSPTPSLTTTPAAHPTPAVAPVLRLGDKGPEVTELQQRLRQLNLYADEINGIFTRPVQDAVRNYQLARGIVSDTYGEYGPATRKSLEAETSNP